MSEHPGLIHRLWIWLRALGRVIQLARVSVIFGALGVLLLLDGQGRDSLVILADQSTFLHAKILFVVGLVLWGLSVWFWGRIAVSLDKQILDTLPSPLEQRAHVFFRGWVPRFAAILTLIGANGALAWSVIEARAWIGGGILLAAAATASAILAAFLVWRRRLIARGTDLARRKLRRPSQPAAVIPPESEHADWRQISPRYRHWAFAIFVASVVILGALSFVVDPLDAGRLGSIFLFMIAACVWTAIPGFLSLRLYALRVPVILLGMALVVIFSLFNDNHDVRTSAKVLAGSDVHPAKPEVEQWLASRPTVESAWDEWRRKQAPWPNQPEYLPVVVVATAGGGLRAAVWTTEVLGRLHADEEARFEERLFAISAVSGGALGSTIYVALTRTNCLDRQIGNPRACARWLFQRDLLGPVSATLFYKDSLKHFWPAPLGGNDRAASLERSFEAAFREATSFDVLARPFHRLWSPEQHWPILLLNGTSVGAGRRIIASNVQIDRRAFGYATDFFRVTGEDVPVSTAINISGRFPFVEPAGTLRFDCRRLPAGPTPAVYEIERAYLPASHETLWPRCGGRNERDRIVFDHVVDGGYFENFGATTINYLLDLLRLLPTEVGPNIPAGGRPLRLFPIVIQISSDPSIQLREGPDSPATASPEPLRWVQDFWAPLSSIFATRGARGEDATYSLAQTAFGVSRSEGAYFHIAMCSQVKPTPPLGWVMSANVHTAIHDRMMTLDCQCNLAKLETILLCLKGKYSPARCAEEAYAFTRAGGKCPPR